MKSNLIGKGTKQAETVFAARFFFFALAAALVFLLLFTLLDNTKAHAASEETWQAHEGQMITSKSIEGPNRFGTNESIVREAYPSGASVVILASGSNYPDALSGATLSGVLDAPIVLVNATEIPANTKTLLSQLGYSEVIVLGGTNAVSDAVLKEAVSYGNAATAKRLAGENRYETNACIFSYLKETLGIEVSEELILATGKNFPDALSVSGYATWAQAPIVLCNEDGVNPYFAQELAAFTGTVTICGGDAVVSPRAESTFSEARLVHRLSGATRFETSHAIARYVISKGMQQTNVVIATGHSFPDALSGAQLAAKYAVPLFLVDGTNQSPEVPEALYSYLNDRAAIITALTYLGGTSAISQQKRESIKDCLDLWRATFRNDFGYTHTTTHLSGETPVVPKDCPSFISEEIYDYTFLNWDKGVAPLYSDVVINAVYSRSPAKLTPEQIADKYRDQYGIITDMRANLDHGDKPAQYQKYIMIHDTEGNSHPANIISWWASNGNFVAAHFIIGKDGSIWQCVPVNRIAHHAGYGNIGKNELYGIYEDGRDDMRGTQSIGWAHPDYAMNAWSIGIELVHVGGEGSYPKEQLLALDKLIAYLDLVYTDSPYGNAGIIIDHKDWRSSNSDTSPEFAGYLQNYKTKRTHE